MSETKPNPGSPEAIEQGCVCPSMDNGNGKGIFGNDYLFYISGDCPLHGENNERS